MIIELTKGYRTALGDGTLVPDSPNHMTSEDFYYARKGDKVVLSDDSYLFAVAIYSLERPMNCIFSYEYQKEENWTQYTGNVDPSGYQSDDFIFEDECYFRVCIKRSDNEPISEADEAKRSSIVTFEKISDELPSVSQIDFSAEIHDTRQKIKTAKENAGEDSLVFAVMSDSHRAVNGTWDQTVRNLKSVYGEGLVPDAVLHLGDVTDGMVSKELTCKYVNGMFDDLKSLGAPLYFVLGNHDSNYFRNKVREFTPEEMIKLYGISVPNQSELYYYSDISFGKNILRLISLTSFDDDAAERYGYRQEEIDWLDNVLQCTPEDYKVLILSHDTPITKMDFWSFHIRNGEILLDVLEKHNAAGRVRIIGLLSGHSHCDLVNNECSFPVIAVACNKCEYFLEKKPAGAFVPKRELGTISEDLWDSLVIDFKNETLNFIRFGAGDDRVVSFAKKADERAAIRKKERDNRKTKIWGHRGALAYAPENTMPSFELAILLGADGIETDVQITNDGQLVICHDETIDRTSDGSGYIKDYSYAKLCEFNFAKNMPRYGRVRIPKLDELLELIADWKKKTGEEIMLNIELKNSIIEYADLEKKVMEEVSKYGLEDQVIYSSFNHDSVRKVRKFSKKSKTGFLFSHILSEPEKYAKKYGITALHPSAINALRGDFIKRAHKKGLKVHVWTVNEPNDIVRLKELGADAIITNYIDRCL